MRPTTPPTRARRGTRGVRRCPEASSTHRASAPPGRGSPGRPRIRSRETRPLSSCTRATQGVAWRLISTNHSTVSYAHEREVADSCRELPATGLDKDFLTLGRRTAVLPTRQNRPTPPLEPRFEQKTPE